MNRFAITAAARCARSKLAWEQRPTNANRDDDLINLCEAHLALHTALASVLAECRVYAGTPEFDKIAKELEVLVG